MKYLFSSVYSRYKFFPCLSDNQEHHVFNILSHFVLSVHPIFPPPLDCDWYIKSIQQDTDAEASLGDLE